jgi:3-phenylpropionate/trans-cinnamate dioxygenase ferredoxin component
LVRVREISLRASDPKGLADLFENQLGFSVLRSEGSVMILTDGYLQVGITSSRSVDGTTTLDHIGVQVDDLEGTCEALRERGWSEPANSTPATRFLDSPDDLQLEIRSPGWGWEDVISASTQLYELVPAQDRPGSAVKLPQVDLAVDSSEIDPSSPGLGFVSVARAEDVPDGGMGRVEVGTRAILVGEFEGSYYAVSDECPHLPRIGRVSEGQRDGRILECPIHRSRFDLVNGRVLEEPARRGLSCFEVVVHEGRIWVRTGPDGG